MHTARGRSDLEVETGDRRWVFEFKFSSDSTNVENLLSEAVGQMQSRLYGQTPHGKELMRVALVFSAKDRRFVAWQQIEGTSFS